MASWGLSHQKQSTDCDIQIQRVSQQHHFISYTIKIVYCEGDMFRPFLGHLQALWENRSNIYLYFNALWDPKCLRIVLYECKIHKFVQGDTRESDGFQKKSTR